ncbi:MAG: dienelactone hydrolase family protein [Thermohalobaculum sp.]|nr:dienelactone hydrolase family protein [Thermohalobaculum sp.]
MTAQPVLTGPRRAPRSGQTTSLVILLHGYGADGNDLIGLAEPLAPYLPDTAFRAPNAPDRCRVNPMGYQWFPISWLDGSPESEMQVGFVRAAGVLDAYITAAMAQEGVGPHQTALVGFSQGTMMSLHVAPRRDVALAGVVGFSGRLSVPERLAAEARVKPPVLLVHGDQDEVIPVAALGEAHDALAAAGFPVATHVSRGAGHGIAPDGLGLALGFLMDRFGIERPI